MGGAHNKVVMEGPRSWSTWWAIIHGTRVIGFAHDHPFNFNASCFHCSPSRTIVRSILHTIDEPFQTNEPNVEKNGIEDDPLIPNRESGHTPGKL